VLVNFYLFCVLILCARNICASFLVPCFVYSMCFDFKNADNGCFKKKKSIAGSLDLWFFVPTSVL
jgi:hypothetical protein